MWALFTSVVAQTDAHILIPATLNATRGHMLKVIKWSHISMCCFTERLVWYDRWWTAGGEKLRYLTDTVRICVHSFEWKASASSPLFIPPALVFWSRPGWFESHWSLMDQGCPPYGCDTPWWYRSPSRTVCSHSYFDFIWGSVFLLHVCEGPHKVMNTNPFPLREIKSDCSAETAHTSCITFIFPGSLRDSWVDFDPPEHWKVLVSSEIKKGGGKVDSGSPDCLFSPLFHCQREEIKRPVFHYSCTLTAAGLRHRSAARHRSL